ncbi:MAG TPA: hypothetical protein V6C65_38980 [Allocoleopsis sp.]
MKSKGIIKSRITQEYKDQDYWTKLSPEEKEWLNQFNREFYCRPSQSQIQVHQKEMGTELRRDDNRRKNDVYHLHGAITGFVGNETNFSDPESELIALETVTEKLKTKIKTKIT